NLKATANPPGPSAAHTSPNPPRPRGHRSRYPGIGSAPTATHGATADGTASDDCRAVASGSGVNGTVDRAAGPARVGSGWGVGGWGHVACGSGESAGISRSVVSGVVSSYRAAAG